MLLRVLRRVVLFTLLGTGAVGLSAQSGVQYVYDDLGRLVGVIDGAGNGATYSYDAVGNLLSIQRFNSTGVVIIAFSPARGSIGTTVTISGAGFSTTPSQNTVTFNGTAATVSSATANQLVVTVPAGATSGTIAISAPAGSATSSGTFTVGANGAPTVTGFTPTVGVAGTAVTVTGTNFDPILANDKTRFNERLAALNTATSTTLTVAVPPKSGSGHITVFTPLGTAVSAGDFIIPPPPYAAVDVGTSGRIPFASGTPVTMATANKIGLLLFDATTGQRVSLVGTNGMSGQVFGCDVLVNLWNPTNVSLAPAVCMEGSGFIDTTVLPAPGTYSILVDPADAATGSLTLTLYNVPADASATITPGGSAVTVTTTTPGQNGAVTFAATGGQRVSLLGTNGINGQISLVCDVGVTLLKPDKTALASSTCMESSGFMDTVVLPVAGTYTIFVDPASWATGSLMLTLYDVPADVGGTLTAGVPVTATMSTPGQNGTYTFAGTAGQRISLKGTNGMSGQIALACDVNVTIAKPDASQLATACMEGSGFIDATTLPTTGTYTVKVDPSSTATGSLTLTLYNVPADGSGTITPGGSAVAVTSSAPGQNSALSFSGTAGQRISLRGTNGLSGQVAGCDVNVTILKPDSSVLAPATCMEGSGFIDVKTLPVTGTYTITIDPQAAATGSLTLTLYNLPADPSTTLTVNGGSGTLTTTTPGQNASATFSGTSGQQVTVHVTGNTMSWVTVKLLKPDGSQLTSAYNFGSSFNLSTQTLPATGTYTITIDPDGTNVGSITLSVTNP